MRAVLNTLEVSVKAMALTRSRRAASASGGGGRGRPSQPAGGGFSRKYSATARARTCAPLADDGAAGSGGHFMSQGTINGRAVQFMVDTGASQVILGEAEAQRINLDFRRGQRVQVSTANGQAMGHMVSLDSVRVGDAQVFGVSAIVLPQPMPYVLLGNTFLTRFQMQRNNDQLTLEKR